MQANYANALCHLNATPLSVAVLVGETMCGDTTNSAQRQWSSVCWAKWAKRKWGSVWAGDFSLSLSLSLLALFSTPLR